MTSESHHASSSTGAPVFVSGLGAVSGYGWGEKRLREGLFAARSAVRTVRGFLPWAPTRSLWLSLVEDEGSGDPGRRGRAVRFAAHEALGDAHDRGWRPGTGTGIVHASEFADETWRELAVELELDGPAMCVSAGQLSATMAVLTATSWIRAGLVHDVLVVCSDLSLTPERVLNGPNHSGLIVDTGPSVTCLPFQQGSVGPNPGEAVVAFVLSRWASSAYGRLLGGAATVAERVSAPARQDESERRRGALGRAVTRALEMSHIEPDAVAYLNAHGSGQPALDAVETSVLEGWLPSARGLYSLKPLVGDCGSAAGAIELLAALYGFSTGVVPAPARISAGHPLLLDGPTAAVDGAVVKASIGRAGECAVVIAGA
jgi:3-oxoacyl-[acyl-carrier-protein] synthase II